MQDRGALPRHPGRESPPAPEWRETFVSYGQKDKKKAIHKCMDSFHIYFPQKRQFLQFRGQGEIISPCGSLRVKPSCIFSFINFICQCRKFLQT